MDDIFEPIQIIWHVGNVCNSICKYCFTNSEFLNDEISNNSWKIIVDNINKEKNIKRVSIIGGEPLLIKELPEIVKNLREDIIINIDSNLTKIRDKWDESFKKAYFCTTIDSIDEVIHNKTRGHSVKETLDGIKFLLNKGNKVMVVIVVTKNNNDTLDKTAKYLLDLGVEKVGISRTRMIGRALQFGYDYFYNNIEDTKQKSLQIIKGLIEKYGKDRIVVYNLWYDKRFFDLGYEYEPSCKCALFRMCIDWEGFAYPCELMPFYWKQFFDVYNIDRPNLKKENLMSIFRDSELFKFFREKMLYYPVGCESCNHKEICNHGCRFYSFLISDIFSSKDITCGTNSVYDVLGYQYYSPLSKIGKARLNGEIKKFIEYYSVELGKKIYDLGCGGGLWTFFLEDLGKEVIGIDNDKTMLLIAEEYKEFKNKKSQFVFSNICKYNYDEFDSAIMLDNVISSLSKEGFMKLLNALKDKVKIFVVEMNKNALKNGIFNYKFNSFDIKENVIKETDEIYKRDLFNKQTGAIFKIISYYWDVDKIKNIFRNYGDVILEKETNSSYLYILRFK